MIESGIAIASLIISLLTFVLSAWNFIRFEAKERSSHTIQYVDPLEQLRASKVSGQELSKQFQEFDAGELPSGIDAIIKQ